MMKGITLTVPLIFNSFIRWIVFRSKKQGYEMRLITTRCQNYENFPFQFVGFISFLSF